MAAIDAIGIRVHRSTTGYVIIVVVALLPLFVSVAFLSLSVVLQRGPRLPST